MTIKKLKSIDIINVLSDLVSEKMKTTVKLPVAQGGTFDIEIDGDLFKVIMTFKKNLSKKTKVSSKNTVNRN